MQAALLLVRQLMKSARTPEHWDTIRTIWAEARSGSGDLRALLASLEDKKAPVVASGTQYEKYWPGETVEETPSFLFDETLRRLLGPHADGNGRNGH